MGSGKKLLKALAAGVENLRETTNQQSSASTSAPFPRQDQQYQATYPSPNYNGATPHQQHPSTSPGGTNQASTPDDERKKAFIIATHRQLWDTVCPTLGAQTPVVKLTNSGLACFYWANEHELAHSISRALDRPISTTMSPEQRRTTVERLLAESWENYARVLCSVTQGELTVLTIRFASYREMVDVMYKAARPLAEQMKNQSGSFSAQQHAVTAASDRLERDRAQMEATVREAERTNVRLGQMAGTIPLYYKNGVPHYGGLPDLV